MESCGDEENNCSDVIENLMNMFGNVMSKDVISAVVENCDGDLNISIDAIMNMTNEGNGLPKAEANQPAVSTPTPSQDAEPTQSAQSIQPLISYASSAARPPQSTGAIPKDILRPKPIQYSQCFWTDQIKEIISNHNQGNRILILMRGLPGSGKSYMATQLIDMIIGPEPKNYKAHILSTDDYFMVRGQYLHDKYKLSEAHSWNQVRARNAMMRGLSPVIIDNTNIEEWEMEPYLRDGVQNGYIIEVLEPKTPWARKANQLAKRNVHNVPLVTIKRKLENYRDGLTGEFLRKMYGLSYTAGLVPPVKRTFPPTAVEETSPMPQKQNDFNKEHTTSSTTTSAIKSDSNTQFFQSSTSVTTQTQQIETNDKQEQGVNSITTPEPIKEQDFLTGDLTNEEQEIQNLYLEAQKKLEEMEKVEKEWENGDDWENNEEDITVSSEITRNYNKTPAATNIISSIPEAKPQRKAQSSSSPPPTAYESTESLMQNVNDCNDWTKITMFMPPWNNSSEQATSIATQEVPIQTRSSGTSMEIGDTDVDGKNKVITATPRNINRFYIAFDRERIPQKRMLDKSSMTNEGIIMEAFRCPNEEKHFVAFRKLFKNIARTDLRDIFDKCCGDVNWSVEIVLDGMNNNQFKTVDTEELSDPEEECTEQCSCLSNYNVIPDVTTPEVIKTTPTEEKPPVIAIGPPTQKKRREVAVSEETIQIKRQIEQNVVIADNHYSKHCLKIRKIRRGEPDAFENNFDEPGTSGLSAEASAFISNINYSTLDCSDDEDGSNISEIDDDEIVTVNLGSTFIAELDQRFGRNDMEYPRYIVPKISVPLSVLNEINALWMESLTFQLDEHAKETAAMMQQDEEFARELAKKEEELTLAGREPEVPDFKEIMDMDMALAIYQKDVAEWRNNMPTDMAAKMTRDKLYNLFPDVDKDTLTELLMAYDNNFNSTVEVLLMSTGRNDVLEQENGINKFVIQEEMKLKDKILQEQRKELSESEWPLLSKGLKVDMSTVEAYREEADQHLARRNLNYQKAQDCIRRGMTQVANYYSEIANFHKQKYEHANGLAVASLMQFHALKNPDCTTIDLHYLRVKEAKELLDVFIDTHISKLRDAGSRRKQMLFFITGRGSHSQGRARIKPATMNRLRERGLGCFLKNPGLLAANVNGDTKLTYQVSVP